MKKKENWSKAGNNDSLLQTARSKNFGAGKFALLSLKSKPQPPVKKVKVPISLPNNSRVTDAKHPDDRSKVSDITILSGEEKDGIIITRPPITKDFQKNGKSSNNDNEVESSVLDMSMKSGNSFEFSLSKAYTPATTMPANIIGGGNYTGNKGHAVQSTLFSSLWPSTGAVNVIQKQQAQNHFKSQKFVKSPKPFKKEVTITKKKTMDISKGLRFSAPAPMTLNRYQPQMGQEKTAPESKEYLEMQAKRKKQEQKQIEANRMAEAKIVIEERLKQAFESEENETGLDDNENKNLATKNKKSLMKKILGKVRQKPSEKLQLNQEKSTAIQAAMAAAAAAVEAATANPGGLDDGGNAPISEEEARAIVSQALATSRQKKETYSVPELSAAMFHPSMINMDLNKMASQEIITSVDRFGRSIIFPVNEVMMKRNEDSVSDLDASVKNVRRCPVSEIHMNDSKQCHGGESVSTLGTPRVFEQLDKLLLSESHRFEQRPSPADELLEDNMVGSAAPPPMVTSRDAKALIDQADSGTMVGDMTAGTARAENAVKFCNIASNCFHPESKSLFMEASTRIHRLEDESSGYNEDSFDDSESSAQEKSSNDGTWSSPNPALTKAIDDAIRKAGVQLTSNHIGQQKKDESASSPILEVGERISPIASPYGSEVTVREQKYPSSSHVISTSSKMETLSQHDQHATNFDSFMKIAALKLDNVTENDDKFDQGRRDSYSTEIDHNLREASKKNKRSGYGKSINDTTPKTQGGGQKPFFGRESHKHHFSDHQFDLLPAENSSRNSVHDLKRLDKHLRIDQNSSKRTKTNRKSRMGIASTHKDGLMVNQGRFLLEKDDAYWDTLSTIASTANGRSTESDAYMDEFVQPGPIPGEITTSSSEMKSVTTPLEAQNMNSVAINGASGDEQRRPEENLNEMLNDVTDLIDADLLDMLPPSKNRRSNDPVLKSGEQSSAIDKHTKPSTSTAKMAMIPSKMRPVSETVDRSKFEDNKSRSFAMASQIAKGIRSVSWGIEEIYEDKNSHLELSDQDADNSEGSYYMTRKAQPCPEGTRINQHRSLHSTDVEMGEEDDLLSRTLELSRGLLETIMGSQIIQGKNDDEEGRRQYEGSNDSREMQFDKIHRNENPILSECRDDDSHKEGNIISETNEKDSSPMIHSRLETLRNQRAKALSKFRESQIPARRTMTEFVKRDRDRLKNYSYSHDYGRLSSKNKQSIMNESYSDDSDIELNYTTSDSNASTTPSQKARDLRVQLNEAMRASREIQISQNQLGNELNSFKRKYYKNPEIELYATNARTRGF